MFQINQVVRSRAPVTVSADSVGRCGVVTHDHPVLPRLYCVYFPCIDRTMHMREDELEPVDAETASVFHLAQG